MIAEVPILSPDISSLDSEIIEINEIKYKIIKPSVESIIKRKIKDCDIIEYYLDECMSILSTKGYELFKKLCHYYATINYVGATEYAAMYNMMYSEGEIKVKRKKAI